MLAGAVLGGSPVCFARPLALFQFEEAGMGTRFTIQVYAGSKQEVIPVIEAAWARLRELNSRFTDYDPESELMWLCRQPPGSPVLVSPELYAVLLDAQKVSRMTGGAFDITIGPLKRLWKQSGRDNRLPSPEKLQNAFAITGYQKVALLPGQTVSLAVPGMHLDLGGIAKGYAAQDLVRLISARGFPAVLVAASGDIAVGEAPPAKKGWPVGVVTPDQTVELPPHSAISTSGDSEQHFEIDGVRYSHVLNPKTGLGLTHRTLVSVRGPDAWMTDALATAISVLGTADGLPDEIRRHYQIWMLPPRRLNGSQADPKTAG